MKVKQYEGRNHRVALAIDFTGATPEYVERTSRLAASVNGHAVKVDFVSIHGMEAYAGYQPSAVKGAKKISASSLAKWAEDNQYDMLLTAAPVRKAKAAAGAIAGKTDAFGAPVDPSEPIWNGSSWVDDVEIDDTHYLDDGF